MFYMMMNSVGNLQFKAFVSLKRGMNTSSHSFSAFCESYKSLHIPTTVLQKIALSVGASIVSLLDPSRGDMIAILGEASGERSLKYMHSCMLTSEEGREILMDAPRINSKTVNLEKLKSLPEGTVGKTYHDFLEKNNVTPDSRLPVQFVDDVELAYTMQRYRETHDLNHAILGMPTNMLDMIAILGEASGERSLKYMHSCMLTSEEGREILMDAPRINSKTVNLEKLKSLPEGTVGKTYHDFLEKNNVTPDSRLPVQFVDDVELAYTMQRYRETHDLNHAILGMPTNMLGEVTVKWVEAYQTRLPMCIGGALFGAMRLKPKQRQQYITTHLPWAIQTGLNSKKLLNVYFEKRWEQQVADLHAELNITPLRTK